MATDAALTRRDQSFSVGTVGGVVLERVGGGAFNGGEHVLNYRIFVDDVAVSRIFCTNGVDKGQQEESA